MTNRERVLIALSHRTPDRIPIDLSATRDSSIVVNGYEKLKDHFGIKEKNILTSKMMQSVAVNESILKILDIDTRAVLMGSPDKGRDVETDPGKYCDEWGVERIQPEGSHYYDQIAYPLSGDISVSDILNYPWPDPYDKGRFRGVKEKCIYLKNQTDYASVLCLPPSFIHTTQFLRGFEDWFIDIASNEKIMTTLFDAVLDINITISEEILKVVGNDIDIVMTSDDLGFQDNLIVSEEAYKRFIKPRHKKMIDTLHKYSSAKVLFHSCGAIYPIIPDFIDIGIEIINPVQVSAKGMDPIRLKKEFGKDISFWGGVDTQTILPFAAPKKVAEETRRMIDILGKDGGYVLCGSHNIQPDVPIENLLAMYKSAREYMLK